MQTSVRLRPTECFWCCPTTSKAETCQVWHHLKHLSPPGSKTLDFIAFDHSLKVQATQIFQNNEDNKLLLQWLNLVPMPCRTCVQYEKIEMPHAATSYSISGGLCPGLCPPSVPKSNKPARHRGTSHQDAGRIRTRQDALSGWGRLK